MDLNTLRAPAGARKARRRVGRGHGSGRGKTSGKGTKGQKARSGGSINPRFEGGQLPIVQRLPYKRGFKNPFRVEYEPVNVGRLDKFAPNEVVEPATLAEAGFVRPARLVKILGTGDLAKPLVVRAHAFSESAKQKIEAAGGRVEVIEHEHAASGS